ncbi:hypothetical protein [Flavobacterium sandaracinum]|uniref:Uncharacterized protein n=1 Tax=Flavobacterium sandaracinum TaxID=2541733 RepID=A0A4R5CWL8_9FLAO|nr:hypothetical protein [Flavobacterium sandaracinum]TDE05169.1 hypothetical protein E0F91_06625 [Flavobacterium sandaracinum]
MFTALAVVAFSGAAMAGTSEVKESNVLAFLVNDCTSQTIEKMDSLDPGNELSISEFNAIYQVLYNNCISKSTTKSLTQG